MAVDPVALFSTPQLIYAWMDYVMKGSPKPALLANTVNYEVMGANEWRHVSSLDSMGPVEVPYFFSASTADGRHMLTTTRESENRAVIEKVNFADRTTLNNQHYYPNPIAEKTLEDDGKVTEMVYASEPFTKQTVMSGPFTGELDVTINKRDVDLGVTVFEQMPDGHLFHLGYWLGRASYAGHPDKRVLLTPGKPSRIPFETNVVSRQMSAGSRLLVLLDVNKNPFAQVNYGTGKDVSDESIRDAKTPLAIYWHDDSFIKASFEEPQ